MKRLLILIAILPLVMASPALATDKYWSKNCTGASSWANTARWADISGGSTTHCNKGLPTANDNVFLDAGSGTSAQTISVTSAGASMHNFNTTGFAGTLFDGNSTAIFNVYGDVVLGATTQFTSFFDYFTFAATTTGHTITTNGNTITSSSAGYYFFGVGGSWALQDDWVAPGTYFYFENGSFDANNHNVTGGNMYTSFVTGDAMTITMGSGTWLVSTPNALPDVFDFESYSGGTLTLNANTSVVKLNNLGASRWDVYLGGFTFNNVWLTGSGTGGFGMKQSSTINNFKDDGTDTHTISFQPSTTQSVTSFTVNGTAGHPITLKGFTPGSKWNLVLASGATSTNYAIIQDSNVTGGRWWAGCNSVNAGNNIGWNFCTNSLYNSFAF